MKKIFIISTLLIAISVPSFAQMVPIWNNITTYGEQSNLYTHDVVLDDSSNVYTLCDVTGYPFGDNSATSWFDPVLHKVSKTGETLWHVKFGTMQWEEEGAYGMKIKGNSIYVYCGRADVSDSLRYQSLIKLNTNGEIQWIKRVNNFHTFGISQLSPKVELDSSGNIFVNAYSGNRNNKVVYKFSPEGVMLDSIAALQSGLNHSIENFIILKGNKLFAFLEPYLAGGFYAALYDSSGALTWKTQIAYGILPNLQMSNDNSLYISFYTSIPLWYYASNVLKLDMNGSLLWSKELIGPRDLYSNDYYPTSRILIPSDNNPVLVCNALYNNNGDGNSIYLCKLNGQTGDSMWVYKSAFKAEVTSAVIDNNSNIYVLGFLRYTSIENESYSIYKFSSGGNLLRATPNNGYLSTPLVPVSIAINKSNDIFVSGYNNPFTDSRSITLRYSQPVNISPSANELPNNFSLSQNYPNPFNPVTVISFQLPVAGNTAIKVYDINGREVSELVNENLQAGEYKVDFNASYLPSGMYFYKLTSGNFSETKKMILIK